MPSVVLLDVCTLVKSCKNYAKCVANVDKTVKCVCPVEEECPPAARKICASNDRTYESECGMKVEACKKKLPLTKKHEGPCGKLATFFVVTRCQLLEFLTSIA